MNMILYEYIILNKNIVSNLCIKVRLDIIYCNKETSFYSLLLASNDKCLLQYQQKCKRHF